MILFYMSLVFFLISKFGLYIFFVINCYFRFPSVFSSVFPSVFLLEYLYLSERCLDLFVVKVHTSMNRERSTWKCFPSWLNPSCLAVCLPCSRITGFPVFIWVSMPSPHFSNSSFDRWSGCLEPRSPS